MNTITRAEIASITGWTENKIRCGEKRLGFDNLRIKGDHRPVLYRRDAVLKILRGFGFST